MTFVGTVGEEGLGDLRGVKRLFNETLKGRIDRFVSIDGQGSSVSHIAIGSARFRVTFKGPGGHSFGSFGVVNPIHALGRAMARIADFQVPGSPRTTFSVGRLGGGTSINTIASEAWMEVDLRRRHHRAAGAREAVPSGRRGCRRAGERPVEQLGAHRVDRDRRDASCRADAVVGADCSGGDFRVESVELARIVFGRLDRCEFPLSLGIPAVMIDAGGHGTGAHTEAETYNATDAWKGTQRAILLTIALANPESLDYT